MPSVAKTRVLPSETVFTWSAPPLVFGRGGFPRSDTTPPRWGFAASPWLPIRTKAGRPIREVVRDLFGAYAGGFTVSGP